MPQNTGASISNFGNCAVALQHADDTSLANALPGQAHHQGIELRTAQTKCGRGIVGPDELALVQPPGRQPDADAVVHEDLHAVGAAVGKQIGVMRPSGAEDAHDSRQRGFGARAHVQRFYGQPDGFDLDHRSSSRSQPPHSLASPAGQVTTTLMAPRRTSMRMSLGGAARAAAAGSCTGTNAAVVGTEAALGKALAASIGARARGASASRTHRRTRFALMPLAIATEADDQQQRERTLGLPISNDR